MYIRLLVLGVDVMNYSFVVVNYNSADYVKRMLFSLKCYFKESLRCEVIIVDNSNQYEIFKPLLCDNVIYLSAGGNVGFGAGCNLGARHASGMVLVFVNPDVIFVDDIIAKLNAYSDRLCDGSIVGFNLIDKLGNPEYSHGSFPSILVECLELFGLHRLAPKFYLRYAIAKRIAAAENKDIEVDYVCGALFALSRCSFLKIGGFNERFFLYFEETELMWRYTKARFGEIVLSLHAVAIHYRSVTTVENSNFKISNLETGRARFFRCRYEGERYKLRLYFAIRTIKLLIYALKQRRKIYIDLIAIMRKVLFSDG